ncbi:MAG: hypothetical protein U0521_18855 [Anaerolineae bacterium]
MVIVPSSNGQLTVTVNTSGSITIQQFTASASSSTRSSTRR